MLAQRPELATEIERRLPDSTRWVGHRLMNARCMCIDADNCRSVLGAINATYLLVVPNQLGERCAMAISPRSKEQANSLNPQPMTWPVCCESTIGGMLD